MPAGQVLRTRPVVAADWRCITDAAGASRAPRASGHAAGGNPAAERTAANRSGHACPNRTRRRAPRRRSFSAVRRGAAEPLDYGFEFDGEFFNLAQATDTLAVFNLNFFDAQVVIEATDDDITPADMIQRELQVVDGFMIGRTEDRDDYDTVLGPSIGYISGELKVFSGILPNSDGTPSRRAA